ncbi:MAG: LuxR C-terminal-related transcriptional regulator, partial [Candidatus Binataceae bacterium]
MAFVRRAGDLVAAHAYAWYQFNPGTVELSAVRARGVSDKFLTRYESEGRSRDPLFQRVAVRLRTACSDIDLNLRERRAFEFQESISSGRIARAIEAPLVVDGNLAGTLNVARDARSRPFTRGDTERLAIIARHASIALARVQHDSQIETHRRLLEAAIDVLTLPLVITGPLGEVLFANRAAAPLLDLHGAALVSGLRMAAKMLMDNRRRAATVFVPRGSSSATGHLRGLDAQAKGAGLTVRSTGLDGMGAIVSFLDNRLATVAGLSPAVSRRESEIMELAACGLNNMEIAAATSISRNTVKQHLKHVFEKMQVRSRAELAAAFA